jgi:hypothetical protein
VKDENYDLLADSYNISHSWKNYFSQSLNMHSFSNVRRIEIHTSTVEPLAPDPSPFDSDIAIPKLKKYKLPGSDQILSELHGSQSGGEALRCLIYKLVNCLISGWSMLLNILHKKIDSNYFEMSLLSNSCTILSNSLLLRLTPKRDEIIGCYHRGFGLNRSASNQIMYIRLVLEKKLECN